MDLHEIKKLAYRSAESEIKPPRTLTGHELCFYTQAVCAYRMFLNGSIGEDEAERLVKAAERQFGADELLYSVMRQYQEEYKRLEWLRADYNKCPSDENAHAIARALTKI